MKWPFPLRYSVPLLLFLAGALLSVVSFFYERHLSDEHVEAVLNRHARFIGNQLSGAASYLLSKGDLPGLKKQISSLGADPPLRYGFVCDDQRTIIAATDYDYLGSPLDASPLAHASSRLRYRVGAFTEVNPERTRILGIFPFLLPPEPGELVSSRKGFLLLEYDLVHPKAQMIKALIDRTTAVALALAVICILTWYIFHRILNQRMQRLIAAADQLSKGVFPEAPRLGGSDELAVLSEAFERMTRDLQSRTEDLKSINERMKIEITERSFIEEALRNSERRFRSIWENSADGMRLTDRNGRIMAVNRAYCALVQMSAEELLEQPFNVVYAENDCPSIAAYQQQFSNRNIPEHERRNASLRSGHAVHLEVSNSFIELGERRVLLSVYRDISEHVTSVEKLRQAKEFSENVIKTASIIIVGVDADRRITVFNEIAGMVTGFSAAEVAGRPLGDLIVLPLADDDPLPETFETRLKTRTGGERVISWRANVLRDQGLASGTICFGIDVTDKMTQEEQRLALERKLLDSQKLESLGVLAGGIAHDFNNLLTAILGNASLARHEAASSPRLTGFLANIEKTSLRAAELCKQMLAYSGKGRFILQKLSMNDVVRETIELLEVSISKKAGLKIDLRDPLPTVTADSAQLRQVLMNLVINASEAIGDKPGAIRVRTGLVQVEDSFFKGVFSSAECRAGSYVFVEVSDNGCGMSPETQARIFDPFFTTKFTGRGLGLAAVLGIVRGHKGALKIKSDLGLGSTFIFLLPAGEEASSTVPAPQFARDPEWKGEGTILVADDDPNVRAVTARMVQACGFEVLLAVDGRHAVELFEKNQSTIRAVLLDMTMPELNGEEAFHQIRQISPQTKVFIVSGYSEEETYFASGAPAGFLQKPFREEELSEKLRTAMFAE